MAADLREVILAKLDELTADHQPCDPGADCLHRAVDALRAVVDLHHPEPWHHGDAYAEAHHTICRDLGMYHPDRRCAGCSEIDEDLSGVTVGHPCRELAIIAQALGIETERRRG